MNKTITIYLPNYDLETRTTRAEFLENRVTDEGYKSSIAIDLHAKENDLDTPHNLRLKIYIITKEAQNDIEYVLELAQNKLFAKLSDDLYLELFENTYMNSIFYTIDPLFKPRKLYWKKDLTALNKIKNK